MIKTPTGLFLLQNGLRIKHLLKVGQKPMLAIAFTFFGIWVLAVAIEFWIRPIGKPKTVITLPKSSISLVSLLLFLFALASFADVLHPLTFEVESEHGEINRSVVTFIPNLCHQRKSEVAYPFR